MPKITVLIVALFLLSCDRAADESSPMPNGDEATEKVCGGIAGIACGEGEYCHFEKGQCQIADGQGVCRPRTQVCTKDYRPVCGCDGKTYGNECTAASFGVSILYDGECRQEEE